MRCGNSYAIFPSHVSFLSAEQSLPNLCRDWCRAQMVALNGGSPDLTLVDFLMSVSSAGETMEYIDLYLDRKKPGVAAFTTEFLKCDPPPSLLPESSF